MVVIRDKRKHTVKINYSKVILNSLLNSFNLISPYNYIKNPLLLFLTLCFFVSLLLVISPSFFGHTTTSRFDNVLIAFILFVTIYFSNFANNIVVGVGQQQSDSLKILQGDIEIKKVSDDGSLEYVFSSTLKHGDVIKVFEGEFIPLDGEVVEGIATVDESAITGESSFVLKEPGTETSSSVTGGTRVVSDWLLIRITSEQGNSYVDQMDLIAANVEEERSPNKFFIKLIITYILGFILLITITPYTIKFFNLNIEFAYLISLICCLLPTLYTALSQPLIFSVIDKIKSLNVLVLREDSFEKAAAINVLFLDKTGTITIGSRIAHDFIPLGKNTVLDVAKAAYISSLNDSTSEGRSIVNLSNRFLKSVTVPSISGGTPIHFNSNTRISGIEFENGDFIKKGAPDAIKKLAKFNNCIIPDNVDQLIQSIALQGGTPLLILNNNEFIGLIHLKDILKPLLDDKFRELQLLGIKTVMCTGDNKTTAEVIAKLAGVNDFIAEAKPEDKINLIREYQSKGFIVAMSGDGNNDAPALAQADIAIAMNTGTVAAKEASNMIDLDSDPTKIIEVIKICKQMVHSKEALTIFSISNIILKLLVLSPVILSIIGVCNNQILFFGSNHSVILATMIYSTLIIPILTPFIINGLNLTNNIMSSRKKNILVYGAIGTFLPLISIKIIDSLICNLVK